MLFYVIFQTMSSNECEMSELADKLGLHVPFYTPTKKSHPDSSQDNDSTTSSDEEDISMQEEESKSSSISELLVLPQLPAKSTKPYSARVLTSEDHLRAMEEKEMEKARKEEEKRLRKLERERKKMEKKKQMEAQMKRKKKGQEVVFTKEEHHRYTVRHENGYDIPDKRYCQWLEVYHPDNALIALGNNTC